MTRKRLLSTLLAAITAVIVAACTAARPIGEWREESYRGQVDHILIIGVTARNERRRAFETQFVDALAARGVSATASYRLLPSSKELTRESVEEAIRGKEIGAVLVTRLAGIRQADVYRRPANYDYERDYVTYYDHALRETTPSYYDEYNVLTLETKLYDTASTALIWKMQSQAIDASRPSDVIAAQIELTIKTLLKRKLIAGKS